MLVITPLSGWNNQIYINYNPQVRMPEKKTAYILTPKISFIKEFEKSDVTKSSISKKIMFLWVLSMEYRISYTCK